MRAVFLGTPVAAVPALAALMNVATVELVVTQPDRPRGRGRQVAASPVKDAAIEWGLPVAQPHSGRELFDVLVGSELDVGVVVAYGRILRPDVLAMTRVGFVNVHFSLLPRWRGAAPVERAILAGDELTGVSLMVLNEDLDTGPLFAVKETEIAPYESAGVVIGRLASIGADLLQESLESYIHGDLRPAAQMETGATFAPRLGTAEARINPRSTAEQVHRVIRAFNPRPGAWIMAGGSRIKILEAGPASAGPDPGVIDVGRGRPILGVSDGAVELVRLQPAGKAPLSGRAWANGRRGVELRLDPFDHPG